MNFRFVSFLVLFGMAFALLGNVSAGVDINFNDVSFNGVFGSTSIDINRLFSGPPLNIVFQAKNLSVDTNAEPNTVSRRMTVNGNLIIDGGLDANNDLNIASGGSPVYNFPIFPYTYQQLNWGPNDINLILDFNDTDDNGLNDYISRTINVHAVDLDFNGMSVVGTLSGHGDGNVEFGSATTFDVNVRNKSNGAAYDLNGSGDANIFFYWAGSLNTSSIVDNTELTVGDINTVSFNLPGSNTGTYDLNIDMNYLGTDLDIGSPSNDGNFSNNTYYTTIRILAADLNANSIASDSTKEYGLPLAVDVSFNNIGDYNGSDEDLNLTLTDNNTSTVVDFNSDFNSTEGDYNTNMAPIAVSFGYTPDSSILGAVNLTFDINYTGVNDADDNDLSNNSLAWTDTNIVSVDAVAQANSFSNLVIADSNTLEFGTTIPVILVFTYVNTGDYNGSDDMNTIYNMNSGDMDEYDLNVVGQFDTTDGAITNTIEYPGGSLSPGSYDLNARVVYDWNNDSNAAEFTTNNNYTTVATLDVNSVDLNVTAGPTFYNTMIDANSVEYGVDWLVGFTFINVGGAYPYDGNGDVNAILSYSTSDVDSNFIYNDSTNIAPTAVDINFTVADPAVNTTPRDVNVRVVYDANTPGASESDTGNNETTLSAGQVDVVAVDLNAETLLINSSSASSVQVEYYDPFTVDFNFVNRGDYNGNGTAWIILDYNGGSDENTFSDTDFNVNIVQSATQVSITPTVLGSGIDMNADVNYTTTTGAIQYNDTDTANVLSRDINVVYVDLNAETLLINGSSANSVAVEVDQAFTADFNFVNRGDYNGNGTAWIMLDFNGGSDENTFSDTDFNVNVVQSATQVSITPTVLGTGIDMNADVNYTTTTGAIQYNDTDTVNVLSRDINVVSIDLNAESLSLDDSSVTTNTAVTATLTFSNVQDDINGAEDLNILFYVDGTLTDYNDDLTAGSFDNADGDLTVSFSYTPTTAGTDDLNILLDYLVGTEDDETNNSENATLTVTAPVTPDSPGGGGGTSGAKKETAESTEFTFSYGAVESPLYTKMVVVNYKSGEKDSSSNLNATLPAMADTDKITDEDVTVIKYLKLTYSGDQSKIENAIVTFTVSKDEASDPALVKLGRLVDGVWEYYTPSSYTDNGTFYTFNVEVPGFSYFAIVLKASSPGEIAPVEVPVEETVEGVTEPATTEPTVTSETTTPEEASAGLAWWIWVIIAVVVVVVIVFVVMGLRK